jgi:hypothetical protein
MRTLAVHTLETLIGAGATIPTLSTVVKCVVLVMVAALVMTAMPQTTVEAELALELLMNPPFRLLSKQWMTLMLQKMTWLQVTQMP